ncbi:Lipoprotein signal peptidase [Lachnospiraceae bacterium TWA4]|nr:Lipoprotein signal peptidase [Lachnospiraceae bacterium TWA4]
MTKYLAVLHLKNQAPIEIIPSVFELNFTTNKGAAFGILQNHQMVFAVLTMIVLVVLLFMYLKIPRVKKYLPLDLSILVLIAGAIGNLIDRLYLSYVVDFLYFKLIDFPIFNVADMYVTCSVILLAILILVVYKEEDLEFFTQSRGDEPSKS